MGSLPGGGCTSRLASPSSSLPSGGRREAGSYQAADLARHPSLPAPLPRRDDFGRPPSFAARFPDAELPARDHCHLPSLLALVRATTRWARWASARNRLRQCFSWALTAGVWPGARRRRSATEVCVGPSPWISFAGESRGPFGKRLRPAGSSCCDSQRLRASL